MPFHIQEMQNKGQHTVTLYTTQERKKPEARETLPAFALSVYVRDFRRLSESLKSDYTLISTSTPQGSSSFMRASMVLELLL